MFAAGNRATQLVGSVRLDHRSGGVVHEHDHRGGAAGAGQLFDDDRGGIEAGSASTDVPSTDEPEDACIAERGDRRVGKRGVAVDVGGGRGDDLVDDGSERVEGIGHSILLTIDGAAGAGDATARRRSVRAQTGAVREVTRPGDVVVGSEELAHESPFPSIAQQPRPYRDDRAEQMGGRAFRCAGRTRGGGG